MDNRSKPARRRAAKRKKRSSNIDNNARAPLQERSRLRFEAILDATDQLLQTGNVENISLYDVARAARMPAASVHYLFPSVDALYVQLAKRYMLEFAAASEKRRNEKPADSWQDSIRVGLERARKRYHDHRGAMELLLGPRIGRDVELEDIKNNDIIAESVLARLKRNYVLPPLPDLNRKLSYGLTISDAFWSRSYIRCGQIDDDSLSESIRAVLAYLKLYLPDHLPRAR